MIEKATSTCMSAPPPKASHLLVSVSICCCRSRGTQTHRREKATPPRDPPKHQRVPPAPSALSQAAKLGRNRSYPPQQH